jgi:hypothetical protein
MFSLAIANAGAGADFDQVKLIDPEGTQLLQNDDFSEGLAHWFPAAQSYFVPWHIDNLFLEILLERGGLGLLIWLALLHYALWQVVFGRARLDALSPFLAASLCGGLLVGLVSSVMDVPRVAFLMHLLILLCMPIKRPRAPPA